MTIRRDVPEGDYHADGTHLSASAAKTLLGHRPPDSTAALEFGSLVHMLLLEPERFEREYCPLNAAEVGLKADGTRADNPTNTNAWKRAVAKAKAEGLKVVAAEDVERGRAMVEAVKAHPTAGRLVDLATDREISLYGVERETGAQIRGRLDLLGPGFVADLKTIGDATPTKFGATAHAFGYHISAANYLNLCAQNNIGVETFAFLLVEKMPTPGGRYRVSVVQLDDEAIAEGARLMTEACRRWLALGHVVDLPDHGDGWHTVSLPPWAYRGGFDTYDELTEEVSA